MDIGAGIVSFKVLLESAKLIKDMGDATARNSAVLDLQEKILGMQRTFQEMAEKLGEANARLKAMEDWGRQAERYELVDYGSGTYAYQLRAERADGEPQHRICPKCFEERARSILQFAHKTAGQQDVFNCLRCKTPYLFGTRQPTPPVQRRMSSYGRI